MRMCVVLVIAAAAFGCAKDKAGFVRQEKGYEHFILGSSAPAPFEQQKIDQEVAAEVDAGITKLSSSDRALVGEIIRAIHQGKAKDYEVMNFAGRITDPAAAEFWGAVLQMAAINSSFPNCAEREMQLASNAIVSRETVQQGGDVRASCDTYVDERVEKDPMLWRVRNRLLWICEGRNTGAYDDAKLTGKAQSYLKGKRLGDVDCE